MPSVSPQAGAARTPARCHEDERELRVMGRAPTRLPRIRAVTQPREAGRAPRVVATGRVIAEASASCTSGADCPVGADDGLHVLGLARRPPRHQGLILRGRRPSLGALSVDLFGRRRPFGSGAEVRSPTAGPDDSGTLSGQQGAPAGSRGAPRGRRHARFGHRAANVRADAPRVHARSSGGGRMAPAARCQARGELFADEFVVSGLKVKYPAGAALRRPVLVVLVLGVGQHPAVGGQDHAELPPIAPATGRPVTFN